MRVRSAALLLSTLAACATAQPEVKPPPPPAPVAPPAPPPPADVSPLRDEARALLKSQAELYWKNWTTGEAIDVAATYKGHEALFSSESIARVKRAESEAAADPVKVRALTDLELYLEGEYIAKETAALTDQVANLEGAATISVEGAELPYRNLEVLLANEPSHAKRVALSSAALPVLAKLNPLLAQKDAVTGQKASELGFTYNQLAARMRDVDLDALAKQADALLSSTEPLYTRAMGAAVHRELTLDLKEMRRADIPRFFHSSAVQSAFPAAQMLPRFEALLAGMGIDLASMKSINIDARPLPRKNPRAVCFPVSVPDDIRLSIKPQGGVDDYAQLFHEGGHALHFASTTTPVWEFQQLGNSTVTEAYAFLLEDRLADPRYLAELGMTGELLNSYVRSAAVQKLYMLRRYAAKVLFERAWHADASLTSSQLQARYKELLGRAYGFPVTDEDAARYLTDHDDFFYSADYLRAWFLAAQIDDALTRKFGDRWWHNPEAGKQLRALWASGNQLTADEVAQQLGEKGLDFAPLQRRLEERLK